MKTTLILAGISGAIAVIFGAFGAHALAVHLSDAQMNTYNTASKYHFYHTLAMLATILLYKNNKKGKYLIWASYAFFVGIILFSGSLYLLACKDIIGLGSLTKIIGPITPIGGLAFILGWIALVLCSQSMVNE